MKETKKDYAIFVDSSADLSPSLLQDGKLQMVAMSYTNGAANCELAGVASDSAMKEFYDGQRRGNLTRTSQVSPQQFIDAFTPALQSGRDVLYISLSGGLTNTKDSFHLANQILTGDYPDSRIIEINSLSATGGIGLLAEEAIANREAGMAIEENAEILRDLRHDVCHVFMVEDLMYLKRGGRIDAHQSGYVCPATLAFAHSYWDGEQIAVGGMDMYIPLCRKHYNDGRTGPDKA